MKRYLITFAYDGTNYNGYQKQPRLKTIQGELEKVLKRINNNHTVEVQSSGRTDAGVHAINQKAHFDLNIKITEDKLRRALNSYTPTDIYIKKVEEVDPTFHARYFVNTKEYIYKINTGEFDPNQRNNVFQYNKPLDIDAMQKALKQFEGEHDFTAFTCQEDIKENCVRHIIETKIIKEKDILIISFLGNGFLKYQVRNMVGMLIDVGSGKKQSDDIISILESKNRHKASRTANPEGLYLNEVNY